MTPAFQQTLIDSPLMLNSEGEIIFPGSCAPGTRELMGDKIEIRYYDTIVMQHKQTKAFLHSHLDRYPLKYDDGRVSSAGQSNLGNNASLS